MRVFVALFPPDASVRSLESQLQLVKTAHQAVNNLRWEQPDRWHITLAFLGEMDPSVTDALSSRIERAASRTPGITLSLKGLGRFGNRMLYAKVDGDRAGLRRLAERTQAAARRCGIAVDDRRFRPHVTIGRSRAGADLRPVVEAARDLSVERFTADEICLVESRLTGEPRYEILGRFALRGTV